MTIFTDHPKARWTVPGLAALAIGAGAIITTADAAEPLPPRTAAQLLADVQNAKVAGFSGTVVQSADLGLPDLGAVLGPSDSADLKSLVSGSHTMRIWYAGPTRVRLALLGDLGESDVIRRDRDLWIWSSADKTANHLTLPADIDDDTPPQLPLTPQEAAERALAKLSPTTKVTTEGTATVAGRSAYELVLTPKEADRTLVRTVRIAVDGKTKLPLRVQVNSTRIADPAYEVGFTDVDFSTPEDRQFTFMPPPGTTVTDPFDDLEEEFADLPEPDDMDLSFLANLALADVRGSAWTTTVVTDLPGGALDGGSDGSGADLRRLLDTLPRVSGSWGSGRLFAGTLVSVLVTDDGRLAAGPVPPERLYAALGAS